MRVLFDIVHPSQVHFFRHSIQRVLDQGGEVKVTSREKDVTTDLLTRFGIEHQCISVKAATLAAMGIELLQRYGKLIRIARTFKPDVMVSRVGISTALVGKILGIPTISYDDMEHAKLQAAIGLTFSSYICTGLGYYRDFGKRHVRFRGPHTLSYMAPDYYQPDPRPLCEAGIDPEEPYFFVRLVSWQAAHDVGLSGSGTDELRRIVEFFRGRGRVIISSEEPLPEDYCQYANPVPSHRVHDLMAFAQLCFFQSGSMAAESAVLGVPTIAFHIKKFDLGYMNALERDYNLVTQPDSLDEALKIAESWLNQPDLSEQFRVRRDHMLAESDDVVQFMDQMIHRAISEQNMARWIA